MAFRIGPISAMPATPNATFPVVFRHTNGLSVEGLGVAKTLTADAELHYVFCAPATLPIGTAKLELLTLCPNAYGDAKIIPCWKSIAIGESIDLATASLNSEGVSTITFLNEKQVVTITNATGGTFTLGFDGQTTSAIAYNASAATVQAVLCALSTIGASGVSVTGNDGSPYSIEFIASSLKGLNVSTLVLNGDNLTGDSPSFSVGISQEATNKAALRAKITLDADTVVADELIVLCLVFESTGWTLETKSLWLPMIIWE